MLCRIPVYAGLYTLFARLALSYPIQSAADATPAPNDPVLFVAWAPVCNTPGERLIAVFVDALLNEDSLEMMCLIVLLLLGCLSTTPALAQGDALPSSIVGFVRPDMKLGIRVADGSSDIHIVVFSERAFSIERDGRMMELDALTEKYPELPAAKEDAIKAAPKSYLSAEGRRFELGEPFIERLLIDRRLRLGTVSHVGSDYFLFVHEGASDNSDDQSRQTVYAAKRIATIAWRGQPRFALSYRPVDRGSGRIGQ